MIRMHQNVLKEVIIVENFDKGRKNGGNKRNNNTSHINNGHNFKIRHRKTTAVKSNKK